MAMQASNPLLGARFSPNKPLREANLSKVAPSGSAQQKLAAVTQGDPMTKKKKMAAGVMAALSGKGPVF